MDVSSEGAGEVCAPGVSVGQLIRNNQRRCGILIACDCANMPEDADGIKQSGAYEVFEARICSYLVLEAFSKDHPLKRRRIIFLKCKGQRHAFNLIQCLSMILWSL